MNRIFRYLFLECAIASLLALVVLTFVVMLPQVLRLVDLWVNKGVSVAVLGRMTWLAIPQFLVAAIPMALLLGVLLTLGRLAQESELVVLKACGVSLYQILRPVALLAVLYTLLALALNMVWLPYSFHQFSILKKALVSATTLALKPQTFSNIVPGLTIYVGELDPAKRLLKGVLVHDHRKPDETVTLTARSGQVQALPSGETALFLQEGTRHQKIGTQQSRELMFATYMMDLGVVLGLQTRDDTKRLDELSPAELQALLLDHSTTTFRDAQMEWHRRWSFPVATLILGLFAVPLGMQESHRSGRSYGFVVAIVTVIMHFMLLSMGELLARRQVLDPISGFWLPNLLMAILTTYVAIMTHRDRSFRLAIWLVQSMATLPQRLLRTAAVRSH